MEEEISEKMPKSRFATALNAVGSSTVWVYDATASGLGKVWSAVKKVPEFKPVPKGMFTKGLGLIKTGEIGSLENKIAEYEKQIKMLYFEIGKEGAKSSDGDTILESDTLKKLLSDVKEHEKEISRLKNRIVELKEEKIAEKIRKKELKKEAAFSKLKEKVFKEKASVDQINKVVENAINTAVKTGVFESRSEEEIFYKVAHDLLDSEMEIKYLAAAELGKIGNEAAVPVLMDAVRYDDPELTAEIVNSLISIGDSRAVPLFMKEVKSQKYRVRIGSLRGLFKLAGDDVSMPALIEALRDDHPEVRRTALTFIGWKDPEDSVPAVSQCLVDEEARVRKAAVSALANLKDESSVLPLIKVLGDKELEIREKALEAIRSITCENIEFDVNAAGKELANAVLKLKQWWQDERMTKVRGEVETEPPIADVDTDDLIGESSDPDKDDSDDIIKEKEELTAQVEEALSNDEDEEEAASEEDIVASAPDTLEDSIKETINNNEDEDEAASEEDVVASAPDTLEDSTEDEAAKIDQELGEASYQKSLEDSVEQAFDDLDKAIQESEDNVELADIENPLEEEETQEDSENNVEEISEDMLIEDNSEDIANSKQFDLVNDADNNDDDTDTLKDDDEIDSNSSSVKTTDEELDYRGV
ncbi:MAG: HEAT repeat domain-containing protein [Desulfamplus sp.]|nr:HEAT repeat domain-containing protein [Desulfamplus sp.]